VVQTPNPDRLPEGTIERNLSSELLPFIDLSPPYGRRDYDQEKLK
jgi:hypothetical protein